LPDDVTIRSRLREAVEILAALGFPRAQQNERSALTLLALLDLTPGTPWAQATNPLRGVTPIMDYIKGHYGKAYAPNTRETFRRHTLHQFVAAGLVLHNPDDPYRPTNSARNAYQIEQSALEMLRTYGTDDWPQNLHAYLASRQTLAERYAAERVMARIPVTLPGGEQVALTPGGQNVLVRHIIEEFCPRWTPGGKVLYIGDAGSTFGGKFDREALGALGVTIEEHGKMPDVIVNHESQGWLVLIEAVTSHGPVDAKRHAELRDLFKHLSVPLIYVTAFLDRRAMASYLPDIAWETDVWCADAPSHLIHFNGERFLAPH
jgi:BsuBI/PstI restriction endonuclease domain/BsuBI/PstI restriction endonuclease HTH domain